MTIWDAVFWALLLIGLYPYVIYPLLVGLAGLFIRRPVHRDPNFRPRLTIVIAAHNEASHIEETLRNKIAQDYPPDLIDVLVVSDGSDDGTDERVKRVAAEDSRITLIRQEPRQGKTAALNLAVTHATGDLLAVFSDANSIYRENSVSQLVSNFADPDVGYATGKMLYANPNGSPNRRRLHRIHDIRELPPFNGKQYRVHCRCRRSRSIAFGVTFTAPWRRTSRPTLYYRWTSSSRVIARSMILRR